MTAVFRTSLFIKLGQFHFSVTLPLKDGERRFKITRDCSRFQNLFEVFALGCALGRMWSTPDQRAAEQQWLASLDEYE
jgi:hypothetical protein